MMELPFRLLVAAVTASFTIPTVTAGLAAYEAQTISARIIGALDRVVQVAQQFYVSGEGSERVRVELPSGLTVRLEYVAIGGEPGRPLSTTARYKLFGQSEVTLLSDPPVPMTSEGGALILGAGTRAIRISYDGGDSVHLALVP